LALPVIEGGELGVEVVVLPVVGLPVGELVDVVPVGDEAVLLKLLTAFWAAAVTVETALEVPAVVDAWVVAPLPAAAAKGLRAWPLRFV
jgi:hypothetical protein